MISRNLALLHRIRAKFSKSSAKCSPWVSKKTCKPSTAGKGVRSSS